MEPKCICALRRKALLLMAGSCPPLQSNSALAALRKINRFAGHPQPKGKERLEMASSTFGVLGRGLDRGGRIPLKILIGLPVYRQRSKEPQSALTGWRLSDFWRLNEL